MGHIHRSVGITDRSSIGEARRVAVAAADSLGFNDDRRSDIGIVATELATNTLLHARTGEFLVCPRDTDTGRRLDLLALDTGTGIEDMSRALEDGFSTIGTAGQGFGAIQRLSDASSVYSVRDHGTTVWAQFTAAASPEEPQVGVVNIPMGSETACGDGYITISGNTRSLYAVVDGLGHGVGAQEAADEAVAVTQQYSSESPAEILTRVHDALKKTRGAAMSIAIVDHERLLLSYGGIGNVSASLNTGALTRSLVSQNGTLGAAFPRVQEFTYPYERHSTLLMFSDGLNSKCSLSGYPGLQNRHPQLIAGVLYRDFTRRRDDATVLLAHLAGDRR